MSYPFTLQRSCVELGARVFKTSRVNVYITEVSADKDLHCLPALGQIIANRKIVRLYNILAKWIGTEDASESTSSDNCSKSVSLQIATI